MSYISKPNQWICRGALRTLRDVGAVRATKGMREYDALVERGLARCVIARGHTVFQLTEAGKQRVGL